VGSPYNFLRMQLMKMPQKSQINAKMILSVTITGLVSISAGPNGYPCARYQRERLHGGPPFFGIVFCLGQFGHVLRGIAEGETGVFGSAIRLDRKTRDQSPQLKRL
jgi:hypothetical protein